MKTLLLLAFCAALRQDARAQTPMQTTPGGALTPVNQAAAVAVNALGSSMDSTYGPTFGLANPSAFSVGGALILGPMYSDFQFAQEQLNKMMMAQPGSIARDVALGLTQAVAGLAGSLFNPLSGMMRAAWAALDAPTVSLPPPHGVGAQRPTGPPPAVPRPGVQPPVQTVDAASVGNGPQEREGPPGATRQGRQTVQRTGVSIGQGGGSLQATHRLPLGWLFENSRRD